MLHELLAVGLAQSDAYKKGDDEAVSHGSNVRYLGRRRSGGGLRSLHNTLRPMEQQLRAALQLVQPYPDGVVEVPAVIPGTAFFPGGRGLWREGTDAPEFPVGKIMVLGHNFDTEEKYHISFRRGSEDVETNHTWKNLVQLLTSVRIAPKEVFFTNFFMGLIAARKEEEETTEIKGKKKKVKNTGEFPGARDPEFVQRCQTFFLKQVEVQHPRLILVLGLQVPKHLSSLSDCLSPWAKATSIAQLDPQHGLIRDVRFSGIDHSTTVVVLTHPCYRRRNAKYRRYAGLKSEEAEIRLIKDALNSTH